MAVTEIKTVPASIVSVYQMRMVSIWRRQMERYCA